MDLLGIQIVTEDPESVSVTEEERAAIERVGLFIAYVCLMLKWILTAGSTWVSSSSSFGSILCL